MAEFAEVASILNEYQKFLAELDMWFRSVRVKYGARMRCGEGCTFCCCGLFDIPLPDALRVATGFYRLSPSLKNEVAYRASIIHSDLLREVPELEEPFFLNAISGSRIDLLTDVFSTVRCPFLGVDNVCLTYEYRPSACVLEGIPMVDFRDGLFDDWCELNFTESIDPALEEDLRLDYYEIQATMQHVTESLKERIPAFPKKETSVFIPSVVSSFESFWRDLVSERG
jgi:Fe-S-cluster containining protein